MPNFLTNRRSLSLTPCLMDFLGYGGQKIIIDKPIFLLLYFVVYINTTYILYLQNIFSKCKIFLELCHFIRPYNSENWGKRMCEVSVIKHVYMWFTCHKSLKKHINQLAISL